MPIKYGVFTCKLQTKEWTKHVESEQMEVAYEAYTDLLYGSSYEPMRVIDPLSGAKAPASVVNFTVLLCGFSPWLLQLRWWYETEDSWENVHHGVMDIETLEYAPPRRDEVY